MDQLRVEIYVKGRSLYCWRAKRLFRNKGYAFEVLEVSNERELPSTSVNATVPQVFIDGRLVGGFAVLRDLDRSGNRERLVRGTV